MMPRNRFSPLAVLVLCCLACGCNTVKDAWNTRGVPKQWEPDVSQSHGEKNR